MSNMGVFDTNMLFGDTLAEVATSSLEAPLSALKPRHLGGDEWLLEAETEVVAGDSLGNDNRESRPFFERQRSSGPSQVSQISTVDPSSNTRSSRTENPGFSELASISSLSSGSTGDTEDDIIYSCKGCGEVTSFKFFAESAD